MQVGLIVVLVNGLFAVLGKVLFDRALATERAKVEVGIKHLETELSLVRELTLRHFDRRADLYWAALKPFVQLYVTNLSRASTNEEKEAFRQAALLASSRLTLLAPTAVSQNYGEMLEWTERALREEPVPPEEAKQRAQQFITLARSDLLGGSAGV